jgi:hypothetical protein
LISHGRWLAPSETRISKPGIEILGLENYIGNEFGAELAAVLMRGRVPVSR